MWILENSEAFDGRRLWLRPGKTYLFGRTAAEPGQLAISHNTISRKHLTITVSPVEKGQAHNPSSRSTLTIEDLATKIGTVVNGEKIKGKRKVIEGDKAEFTMGKCPNKFTISWEPVVFAFSFTSKELQTDPLTTFRKRFEQLDIKLVAEYVNSTTHVVSKKRNTAKGLEALINGKHIVTETFLDAVEEAGSLPDGADATDLSPLEQDFNQYWPDAMQHLPPRGGEPVQHPDSTYAPDPGRRDVFEGYTFIFYDQVQYNNLLKPITSGGGKGFLRNVIPEETSVDEFVQYVKSVAGEKGLGAFNDGSEGKGVVVVRFVPSKGGSVHWYVEFFRSVSLRLDHRPIEQSEFLEAILIKDASILRRSLEVESAHNTQHQHQDGPAHEVTNGTQHSATGTEVLQAVEASQPAPRRGARRTFKRRFAGFDDDDNGVDMDDIPAAPVPPNKPGTRAATQNATQAPVEEEGLFVSQEPDAPPEAQVSSNARVSQKKRRASPLPEDDLMDGMATASERFKRQRVERGEVWDEPVEQMETQPSEKVPEPKKKIKKEFDILAIAAKNREQEEARARAEKEDLANLPDDVDLSEIRRLNIVEELEVRQPSHPRTREQDIRDGRWDPKWNGMKNFKRFRQRGEVTGRQPAKTIVPLTQVKTKEFGVGDDYWLEDEETERRKKNSSQAPGTESQPSVPTAPSASSRTSKRAYANVLSDSSDEESNQVSQRSSAPATRTRGAQVAASQTQSQAQSRSQASRNSTSQGSKRAAPEPAAGQQPSKRSRPARRAVEIADSDSDDELKFRFGKRR
ncbi:campothecin resistance conferring [Fusarium beomiforme]|uniref:Campothecin resistance conferring n=1 Tax=Fusarium beomiforme TaxID=44412 RepID=A0A9P5DZ72_9HYPO|nr:campothecin resistance conferring [Fusarium beomiforme]